MPPCNYLEVAQSIADESKVATSKEKQSTVSYIDLLTNPRLRMKNLLSCIIWFTLGLVFYGGKQYIGQTSSNVFITIALAGVLQVNPSFKNSFHFIYLLFITRVNGIM